MKSSVVPRTVSDYCHSWIDKNPEYEYRFFDDRDISEFISKEFPSYLPALGKIKHGAVKADLWRYLITYKYGGVYADFDSRCVVPLRDWINPGSKWVTHLGINRDVCQWLIMSIPGNRILENAAEKSYHNIINGGPPCIEFRGFAIDDFRNLVLYRGSSFRTSHPVMTIAGPPVMQQASEECFIDGSAQQIFKSTQVVCVSDQQQCEMNGNVSHDCPKDEYLKALTEMATPHYESARAELSRARSFYAKIRGRLKIRTRLRAVVSRFF